MRLAGKILVFITLCCLGFSGAANSNVTALDSLLSVLDQEIPQRFTYIAERQHKITQSRRDLSGVTPNDTDAYNILRTLYELYRPYDIDSALLVARMRLEAARHIGDPSKIMSSRLNIAESSIAAGSYHTALHLLDSLDRSQMRDYHLRYTYDLYQRLWHRLALNDGVLSQRRRYEMLEKVYLDSLALYPRQRDKLNSRDLINRAQAFYKGGQTAKAKTDLAEAALLDVRSGRRDMESLMRLAYILCQEGDYERAYLYNTTALKEASDAHAQARTTEILQAAAVIDQAHTAMMAQSMRNQRVALAIIAALALLAILALVFALCKARSQRRASRRLEEANRELEESNRRKELYISQLFDIHSRHIVQLTAIRKQALQQLRAGRLEQLEKSLSSHNAENAELQGMYTRFDEMYLSMYPDFLKEYNQKVHPEHRVDPETRTLTPELRVQALINMGITDSGRIARLLHYSPQTVYNYRSRLKTRLLEA